jgi:hypothetical protein
MACFSIDVAGFHEALLACWEAGTNEAIGLSLTRARHLARIGLATLIGTQSLERPVDRKRLLAVFDEYQEWLEAASGERRGGRRS